MVPPQGSLTFLTSDEIDRLLAVPLTEFVEERNRLASALKAAGRREDAKRVGQIGKPTLAVWVVNQLARTDAASIERLASVSAQLRQAPLGRGAVDGYAQLVGQHRDALRVLRAAAERILGEAEHAAAPAQLERVIHTLRAGMTDAGTGEEIVRGRLLREIGEVDFTSMSMSMSPSMMEEMNAPGGIAPLRSEPSPPGKGAVSERATIAPVSAGAAGASAAGSPAAVAREREDAKARAAAERERLRAHEAAERELHRLRTELALAHGRITADERAVEAARRALDAATRAVESARHGLEENEGRAEAARRAAGVLRAALAEAEAACRAAEIS